MTSTAPPTASDMATVWLNGVSVLKWDGTWRHACREMPPTSTMQSAAKIPSSHERKRRLRTRYEVTQVIAMRVNPNDRPKVVGLRQDTGPSQGPPRTKNTPK